ncbi:MAG: DUF4136 domain-containing protein [Sphingosinicella sp.]|nr:DUF4136 domain-containing protein [Sphingosinicella sp.]
MKAVFLRGCAIALAASLAACTTPLGTRASPVDVTRFHLGQPVARATIAIEPVDAADRNSLEYNAYRNAVGRQLGRLGWTVVANAASSEQIALIDVEQGTRAALAQRSPVSIGVGGSTGGWGSGVGAGINFGLGGGKSRDLVSTLLEVSIRRRSDSTVFWEGRAETEARVGSADADRSLVVEKLSEALFRDFPGESGRTIRLK